MITLPNPKIKACVNRDATCDLCKRSLFGHTWFFDAAIPRVGQWAWLCHDCFVANGCELGIGRGQCYDSQTLVKQTMV